jgi:hypothetical protein
MDKNEIDKLKLLPDTSNITALNYGPYDNGHILVGTRDGNLLVFEFISLD